MWGKEGSHAHEQSASNVPATPAIQGTTVPLCQHRTSQTSAALHPPTACKEEAPGPNLSACAQKQGGKLSGPMWQLHKHSNATQARFRGTVPKHPSRPVRFSNQISLLFASVTGTSCLENCSSERSREIKCLEFPLCFAFQSASKRFRVAPSSTSARGCAQEPSALRPLSCHPRCRCSGNQS